MKVSRSLVDGSVHSETPSHQRVQRELRCEMVNKHEVILIMTISDLPTTFCAAELSLETLLATVHV